MTRYWVAGPAALVILSSVLFRMHAAPPAKRITWSDDEKNGLVAMSLGADFIKASGDRLNPREWHGTDAEAAAIMAAAVSIFIDQTESMAPRRLRETTIKMLENHRRTPPALSSEERGQWLRSEERGK